MKKILLLLVSMYGIVCYSQTIMKLKLPSGSRTPSLTQQKAAADFNTAANQVKGKSTDSVKLLSNDTTFLKQFFTTLMNPAIASTPLVQVIKDKGGAVDTSKNESMITAFGKISGIVDTIKTGKGDTLSDLIKGACPKVSGAILRFKLGISEGYIGIIEDTNGMPLQSYSFVELEKDLFYNKLKEAFTSLCDTSLINTIIDRWKHSDPDLYTRFLEAKDNLANTNGLSGTFYVKKDVIVHFRNDASDNRPAFSTSTATDYPDIHSITKAKRESKRAIKKANRLRKRLDNLYVRATQAARDQGDGVIVDRIKSIVTNVDSEIDSAARYQDSISKFLPDKKILHYYNKTIQLYRRAQQAAQRGIDLINDANGRFTLHSSHGLRSYPLTDLIPPALRDTPLPVAGRISADTSIKTSRSDSAFTISSVQVQFQDGFIENIKVFGKLKGDTRLLRFENIYPIGFSTKKDFKNLIRIHLYERSNYLLNFGMYITLGEFISYDQNLANYNKDYSPANQVLTINPLTDSIKEVPLYKDQTSRILEMEVFSDLKGTDDSNPNGLIQVELNKRLNFFSSRAGLNWKLLPWHWWNKKLYENFGNMGFFNFITPQFSLNKIESNQKRLILNHIDTLTLAADTSKPIIYTSTINLLKHQVYRVGFDISWFLFDFPNIKSTIDIGTGIHFGRTALQDTTRTRAPIDPANPTKMSFKAADGNNVLEYGVNTFQWGPYITWQIFPDSRFGVSASARLTWFKALTSNFVQVRDSAHYLKFIAGVDRTKIKDTGYTYYDYGHSNAWFIKNIAQPFSLFTRGIASAEIFAYFNAGSDGNNKLFFRYRLNWDVANPKENFHQIQVGFSTYITATKEYAKLKKSANVP